MKHFKLLLASALTLLIALVIATPATAKSVDAQVTVDGLDAGDKVNFYKVLEWDDKDGWVFADGFKDLTPNDLQAILDNKITFDLASKISGQINKQTGAPDPVNQNPIVVPDGQTKVSLATNQDGDEGLYMAIITAVKPDTLYNPVFVAADYTENPPSTTDTKTIVLKYKDYFDKAVAKKVDDKVEKTTDDHNKAVAQAIDSYVGEEVTFYVDTTMPVYAQEYKSVVFNITDTATPGVTINPDASKYVVEVDGTAIQPGNNTYTLTVDPAKNQYTVEFAEAFIRAGKTSRTVHIEYKGTVTNAAIYQVNPDDNDVNVTFTNGPTGEVGLLKDTTNHYTFTLGGKVLGDEEHQNSELVKIGMKWDEQQKKYVPDTKLNKVLDNGVTVAALKDAEFTLYEEFDPATNAVSTPWSHGTNTTKSDANGILVFTGLDAGTYYVKETQAPTGYVKNNDVHRVKIVPTYKVVNVTEWVNPADYDDTSATAKAGYLEVNYETQVLDTYQVLYSVWDADAKVWVPEPGSDAIFDVLNVGPHTSEVTINESSFLVPNTPGSELPSTGGMGTTIFYVVGSAMVICAGVLLVTKRRIARSEA